ncbi:MAG: branched-chain amino acid ABC transporter permease [Leucobacter sp.]
MELAIQGILLGGLYATTALGLSLVFGTMRMVNLAHGEFLVVGAYLTSIVVVAAGADPLLVALPVAVLVAAAAYPLQRYVLTPVMKQGEEAPITATFGVSIIVSTALLLLFSSNPRSIKAPYSTSTVELLGINIRVVLLLACVIGVVLVVALTLLLKRTPFGRRVRAASIDPEAAGLVGINVNRTYAQVFSLAAGLAAIGGVLIGMSFSVDPNAGMTWLLRAFTVIVIGGLGSVTGTLYGGVIVGLVETVGGALVGAQYRDVVVFGVLVIVLLVRPNGLFVRKAVAR